ncbi:MAG: 16S rRNA (cytidine(1402)-2'-O)-methyltransferase [Spongiibacteraceae bacterium]
MQTPATLYVIATPIGNLGDMVPRALEILQSVSIIAAEDTRHSRPLLQHFNIDTPLIAYHDHSSEAELERLLVRLRAGESVALISDAGTPLVSDPGYRFIDAAHKENIRVIPVPGACALVAALSAAGLPSNRFAFEGFFPPKQHGRLALLQTLRREPRTLIFYEAPHRLLASLRDIEAVMGPGRQLVLARELTKMFETVKRLPAAEMVEWVAGDSNQQRGECVVLISGCDEKAQLLSDAAISTLDVLRQELPLKQAAALAAKICGVKKNQLYKYALDNPVSES